MPIYRLYTPNTLRTTAEFTSSYSYSTTGLTFNSDTTAYKRLFKLSLIPAQMISRFADVTVVLTIGLQNSVRSSDSDPKFLISDGKTGIGFDLRDTLSAQCRGVEGLMDETLTSYGYIGGVYQPTSTLSEEFVLSFNPSQRWGSCYYGGASGVISPISYSRSIYLDQGLWLEAYREGTNENYIINYVIVDIHEN